MSLKNPYTPGAIVNYFLSLAKKEGRKLTHLQLQKLVYFAHAWHLAFKEAPLINETFEAWEYGPVCSSIYHEYKNFGSRYLENSNVMYELDPVSNESTKNDVPENDKETRNLLDSVWKSYIPYDGMMLSQISHFKNPKSAIENPWVKTRENAQGLYRKDINNIDIKNYFSQLKKHECKY